MAQKLVRAATPASGLNPTASASDAPANQPWRLHGSTFVLDSDLSADMEVRDQEIEAIARLLGDDLEAILAER